MNDDYTHEEHRLAQEIASTLNDWDALPLFRMYARKYKEAFLRKILVKVMSIPDHKIKRTRGALFTFLVNQSGNDGGARN